MDPITPPQNPQITPASVSQTPQARPEQGKMIITILALLFFTPLGIIFMWVWMKNWPTWLKIIITLLPVIFIILTFLLVVWFGGSLTNTNLTKTSAPILESTVVATNSATIDPINPNLMIFDSPCMSFKYPKDWELAQQNIFDQHKMQNGFDAYGETVVALIKKSDAFSITAQCHSNYNNITLQQLEDSLLTGTDLNTGASQKIIIDDRSEIIVSDVPGIRILVNSKGGSGIDQLGVVNISAIKKSTIFIFKLEWDDPARNNITLKAHQEFEDMIPTVQIKDFFQKQ